MFWLLALTAWLPHDYHASLTRMELNQETQLVEVTLHLFTNDLEDALATRTGKRVVIDSQVDVDKLIMAYLKDNFQIFNADNIQLIPQWIGMEVDVKTVWVYIEFNDLSNLNGARLHNTVFFDLFNDQVNTVNLLGFNKKRTLIFKGRDKAKPLDP